MNIKPLRDQVLIKDLSSEAKEGSVIIVPEDNSDRPTRAEVLEVGSGRIDQNGNVVAMSVKKGDKVVLAQFASTSEVKDGDDEYLLISESDILAILG